MRECGCPEGKCSASAAGRAVGRMSVISDVVCRAVPVPLSALGMLDAAAQHMRDRAATYDSPGGERSMGRAVAAFNALADRTMTESEGWLLMECLKAVRDFNAPGGHADSQEDRIAYAALGAEARRMGR